MNSKYVVFDLFGVIFYISTWRSLQYLGLLRSLSYVIRLRQSPIYECFALLDKMRLEQPGEFQNLVAYKGIYLPNSFCLWLRGEKTTEEMHAALFTFIESLDRKNYFKNKNHKEIIYKFLNIIADPKTKLQLIYACNKMIGLIKNLTNNGFKCYVLSNIDKKTHTSLCEQFSNVFRYFDGQIVSWQVHLLKPQQEIFLEVQKRLGLTLESCYYIDDQEENIKTAQDVGMNVIFFHSAHQLQKQLKKELHF